MTEERQHIISLNEFELVQYFQENLIIRATGGSFENEDYSFIRLKLIEEKKYKTFIPKWIVNSRTTDQFWAGIKAKFSTYAERREFIRNEFNDLLSYLELKIESPLDESLIFDESYINSHWKKAIERQDIDPEGAITQARTLIESVLKYILDEKKIEYKESIDLPELYKEVSKSLNLAPENHQEQIFKQILGGASSIISGLGAMRNKLGDAHGKSKTNIKPKERHSQLAVNLAGSIAIFLFKTYKETSGK
jgi:hypothetical protein